MAQTGTWVFDGLPPSGARRGGNPAEHAFKHKLSTFVREVVQNANDQARLRPRVAFRLELLRGEALKDFLAALDMNALRVHLDAASSTRIKRALVALDEREELLLMHIEDYGTEGLTGAESEGESHFRALCKDTLFSHKRERDAGGSYGLGKSVLWVFSSLSTVLFSSTLIETPRGQENPRFIGRAELPSHRVARNAFAGSGWLGIKTKSRSGARAESLWGEDARKTSDAMGFTPRVDHALGTSICIVGFQDPTADEESSTTVLARRTQAAIAEYFWPAMSFPRRPLMASVAVANERWPVRTDADEIAPFVAAWRREKITDRLERAGDIATRAIPFRVPARRDGAPAVDGEVQLTVRLDSARERHEKQGRVAYFRGPGMVVKYDDRRRLALGMRPFHAVVACGVARQHEPTPSDHAIEQFLRIAEPPSHDRWEPTQRLKDEYERGYAKALTKLRADVDDALRALLIPRTEDGRKGPERLQRRFPIGRKGATDRVPMRFRITDLHAVMDDLGWSVSASIEPIHKARPWTAEVLVSEVDERGARSDVVAITNIELTSASDAVVELENGKATIVANKKTNRVSFRARTEKSACIGALEVEVRGQLRQGKP